MALSEVTGVVAQAGVVGDWLIWGVVLGLALLGLGYVGGLEDWRPRWFFTLLRCGCPASSRVQWSVDGRIIGNGSLLRVARRNPVDWPAMLHRRGVTEVILEGAMGRRLWRCQFTLDSTGERLLAEQPPGRLTDPVGDPWPQRLIVDLLPDLFRGTMPFKDCGLLFVSVDGRDLAGLVDPGRSDEGGDLE